MRQLANGKITLIKKALEDNYVFFRNFDFDSGTPMEGRFTWESAPIREVPLPYLQALPSLSDEESSETKENRVLAAAPTSSTATPSSSGVPETPSTSSSQQPPDLLRDSPTGSIQDLRTPAQPSSSSSSSTETPHEPPTPSSSTSYEHLGARTKETAKDRKITGTLS